ncbi:MAG: hypothetical protein RIR48_3447 [Bacteroidota bacterium]|jgi:hypothetical protein
MKNVFASFLLLSLLSSCSLTSTTLIQPNQSFLLGNNEHGKFSVKVKNLSENELRLWKTPNGGGKHSPVDVKSNETVKIKVDKNTALRIENNNSIEAKVVLLVRGDLGLSMGYKK